VESWNDAVTDDEGEISIWNVRRDEWKVTVNQADVLFEQEERPAAHVYQWRGPFFQLQFFLRQPCHVYLLV
jgi:hypothetical protein